MPKKKTHVEFVNESYQTHNNKYSYPEQYINNSTKMNIVCPDHGPFSQMPYSHLAGHGCPKCKSDKLSRTMESFITEADIKYNNFYEYPNPYVSMRESMRIKCPLHGLFDRMPGGFLDGFGCPSCSKSNKLTQNAEKFIVNANKIHDGFYSYPSEYVGSKTKMNIQCPLHGPWEQKPVDHLQGHGCPSCAKFGTSYNENEYLDNLKIQNLIKQYRINLPSGSFYKADGYDPDTNTIYEYHGKYWHGHPDLFEENEIHPTFKIPAAKLYKKTLDKEQELKSMGYNVVSIWGI